MRSDQLREAFLEIKRLTALCDWQLGTGKRARIDVSLLSTLAGIISKLRDSGSWLEDHYRPLHAIDFIRFGLPSPFDGIKSRSGSVSSSCSDYM